MSSLQKAKKLFLLKIQVTNAARIPKCVNNIINMTVCEYMTFSFIKGTVHSYLSICPKTKVILLFLVGIALSLTELTRFPQHTL